MFIRDAFLPKLESLAFKGTLKCGWVDPASPPQPPNGPPDQWCVNSSQGAMGGVWASCIFHTLLKVLAMGMWSNTDVKAVKTFEEVTKVHNFYLLWGEMAQNWASVHIPKSSSCEHIKQDWCESRENFLTKDCNVLIRSVLPSAILLC